MKNVLNLLIGFACCLSFVSCEKALPMYDSEQNRLNFEVGPKEDFPTPVRKSFIYDPEEMVRDTIYVPVVLMGEMTDYDRPVSFEQVEVNPDSVYNAIPGVHYVSFDDEEVKKMMILPAGQASVDIPIIALRDVTLRDTLTVLKLRIVGNDFFASGDADRQEIWVEIGDIPVKPKRWTSTFGDYGLVKHRFLIETFGWRWDDETLEMLMADIQYMYSIRTKAKNALKEENDRRAAEGLGPLCESDGTVVKFPG